MIVLADAAEKLPPSALSRCTDRGAVIGYREYARCDALGRQGQRAPNLLTHPNPSLSSRWK